MKIFRTETGVSLPSIPFLKEYTPKPPPKHRAILSPLQKGLRDCLLAFTPDYNYIEVLQERRKVARNTANDSARRLIALGLLESSRVGQENWRMRYRLTPKGIAEKNLIMESKDG
jgi:DNA-binding MarR family transcriptional regulator